MNEQTVVVYTYNGIPFKNKKDWIIDTQQWWLLKNNRKGPVKGYTLYNSTYIES